MDYTIAGITGVTESNLMNVNSAVLTINNGSTALTNAQIQALVTGALPTGLEIEKSGDTITAKLKKLDGTDFTTGTVVYDWYRNGSVISGQNQNKYDSTKTTDEQKDETNKGDSNSKIEIAQTNGWIKTSGKWQYLMNGQPFTGWKQIDGKWYLFDKTGIMQVGWQEINGVWYLLKDNGEMATGWQLSNGEWYYLYRDGAMASNTVIDGYKLGGNGAWI